jgi:squalene synthase HpnC
MIFMLCSQENADDSRPQHNRDVLRSSNPDRRVAVGAAVLSTAEKETRRLARSHHENFLVASVLLPRSLRQPFYNVYAFCRTADDLADQSPSSELALQRLDEFQSQLDDTFAERPRGNLFIALSRTIQQFQLPKQPFDDLLAAFRQDQSKRRYANHEQLLDYCSRSANPVGRIVLRLGDCDDEVNAQLSDQICSGLQLANFWQDVARDYVIGRVYLPADQMSRFGVSEEMLGQSSAPQPLRQLLASECDRAEDFFECGLPLAGRVPHWLANDIKLFAYGGLATLEAIRRIDFDVLHKRPTVSRWRQAGLVVRAVLGWI